MSHCSKPQCLLKWLSQRVFVCFHVNASLIIHHNPLCNPSCRLNLCVTEECSGEARGAVSQTEDDSLGSMVHAAIVWASVDGHQSWWESCEWDTTFIMWGRVKQSACERQCQPCQARVRQTVQSKSMFFCLFRRTQEVFRIQVVSRNTSRMTNGDRKEEQGRERAVTMRKKQTNIQTKNQCRLNYVCYQHNEKCLY